MKVDIVGVLYDIEYVDDPRLITSDGGVDAWGVLDGSAHKIRIDNNIPDDRKEATLMHELVHGAIAGMGIRELMKDGDPREHLEIPVDQLARALVMSLRSLGIQLPTTNEGVSA